MADNRRGRGRQAKATTEPRKPAIETPTKGTKPVKHVAEKPKKAARATAAAPEKAKKLSRTVAGKQVKKTAVEASRKESMPTKKAFTIKAAPSKAGAKKPRMDEKAKMLSRPVA